MKSTLTFVERLVASAERLSPAERQVAQFFRDNREEVLVASASSLATKIGTSDATVIRTAKALGYPGLDDLRRRLAAELRQNFSPASRLARTLGEVGDEPASAFGLTLDIHVGAIEALRQEVSSQLFQATVDRLVAARRVCIFGIGPSSAMAYYFAIQLGRFGIDAAGLTQTGLLFADDLHRLRRGDLVIILAYTRIYRELEALLDHVDRHRLTTILLTDTLGTSLRKRVDLVLPVSRGRVDWFSMHTSTLGLIEAILVGVAAKRPAETVTSLKLLNGLRAKLVGQTMEPPVLERRQRRKTNSMRTKMRR